MKTTEIYYGAARYLPANADVEYHIETLFKFPENTWFSPNNISPEDAYTICNTLAILNLVAKMVIPLFRNNVFQGTQTIFLYRKDLDYSLIKLPK